MDDPLTDEEWLALAFGVVLIYGLVGVVLVLGGLKAAGVI